MQDTIQFDEELIKRYDIAGPRYTSYPTAPRFHADFGGHDYEQAMERSNLGGGPLSLYFHIPFCDTVCFYCGCSKVVTKHRDRAAPYLERLHREIEMQAERIQGDRVVDQLHWGGGTPTFISHDEMRALMAKTGEHFQLKDDDTGEYSIEVDPREASDETIGLLREIGFNRISLGVQDFDPVVQKAVNRIQSEDQTFGVLKAARDYGFHSVSVDLIYGLPHQSVASFDKTLDKMLTERPDRMSIFNYAHLPERFKPQRRIHADDLPSPSEKLDILHHTIDKLTDAGYVFIGMDHFALPEDELALAQNEGTLYRNFQGYSTHADCDMISMGITSIGYLGGAFSQNEKELEPYYERIDKGELPIIKGYELNDDDHLRRAVITQLICHFKLDIQRIEQDFGIVFREYFADTYPRLEQMAADGLIEFNDRRIDILPAGRLLARQVCMVFDAYLQQTTSTTKFSRAI